MKIMLRVPFSLVVFSYSWLHSVDHQALLTRWHGSSAAIRVSPVLREHFYFWLFIVRSTWCYSCKVARAYQLYHL